MIILASGSPRRRELLRQAGYTFECLSADIDESVLPNESPIEYTLRVCRQKAEAVRALVPSNAVIVTADTSVVVGNTILGKPADPEDAIVMLRNLRGQTHQVITAFSVLDVNTNTLKQDWVVTDVTMRDYSEQEIARYVASGDPMDKAGGYAIQNADFAPVAMIQGCYANVVGLPVCRVAALLSAMGYPPPQPLACSFPVQCAFANES
ncbi:MAG: hypothetical protein CUN55_05605 [Phototrophicales bacterium]|nr:MAG: hypothetical protein CUN55_05605 [Phototrophicales bacterium]